MGSVTPSLATYTATSTPCPSSGADYRKEDAIGVTLITWNWMLNFGSQLKTFQREYVHFHS